VASSWVLAALVAVTQVSGGRSPLARAEWAIAPAVAEAPAMAPPPARVAAVQAGSQAPNRAATGASGSLIAVTPRHASSSSALAGVTEHHERPLGEPAAFPFYPTGPPRIS
jgi:hypothetical protein